MMEIYLVTAALPTEEKPHASSQFHARAASTEGATRPDRSDLTEANHNNNEQQQQQTLDDRHFCAQHLRDRHRHRLAGVRRASARSLLVQRGLPSPVQTDVRQPLLRHGRNFLPDSDTLAFQVWMGVGE